MKIAICCGGHLRTFDKTAKSARDCFSDHQTEYYVHCWENLGSSDKTWWSPEGDKAFVGNIAISQSITSALNSFYPVSAITVEKEKEFAVENQDQFFQKRITEIDCRIVKSMFYSAWSANELRKNHCKDYDIVVKSRFDVLYFSKINEEHLHLAKEEEILFVNHSKVQDEAGVLSDIFAFGAPHIMDIYFDFYKESDTYQLKAAESKHPPEEALTRYLNDRKVKISKTDLHLGLQRLNGKAFYIYRGV